MKAEAIQEKAFSYATIQYTTEERAKLNGMSARKIAEIVNQEHKVTLHLRTITRYVQKNKIRVGRTPQGPPPGLVDEERWMLFKQASVIHVCLKKKKKKKKKCVSLLKSVQ